MIQSEIVWNFKTFLFSEDLHYAKINYEISRDEKAWWLHGLLCCARHCVIVYLYNICEQDLLFFGTASSKDYFSIEREMDQTQ